MENLDRAKELLDGATKVTVLTGAGISTDSGIPDFRGPDGIWTKNPEAERSTNIDNFYISADCRRTVWDAYIKNKLWSEAKPNAGHLALANLSNSERSVSVITQNIDGLHQAAGSEPVHEIHGSLQRVVCLDPWCHEEYNASSILSAAIKHNNGWYEKCPGCNKGYLKPAIVMFGEDLPALPWHQSVMAASQCDVFLSVGTTLMVWPAADLPVMAQECGAKHIIINGSYTEQDNKCDILLRGSISEILPLLVEGTV